MIAKQKFLLKKDGTCRKSSFCMYPELIENYEKAIADKDNIWICHHKKEEFYTQRELINLGMYYNVPPEDLVFVKDYKEHYSWPHKGRDLHKGESKYGSKEKSYQVMRRRENDRWNKKYPAYYKDHKEEYAKRTKKAYEKDKKIICIYEGKEIRFTTLRQKIGSKEAKKYIINEGK